MNFDLLALHICVKLLQPASQIPHLGYSPICGGYKDKEEEELELGARAAYELV